MTSEVLNEAIRLKNTIEEIKQLYNEADDKNFITRFVEVYESDKKTLSEIATSIKGQLKKELQIHVGRLEQL